MASKFFKAFNLFKGKVSPTIKSVKPNFKKTGKESRSDEFRKRYQALDKAEDKVKSGKQMMKEGQKERKNLVDTGKAFKFKGGSRHAVTPGENPKVKYKGLMEESKPQKKFKKGKELREKKMGGGMMGRRFGMKQGTPKPKSNVDKIRETFAPKGKNLKPVDPKKQKGLAKLPRKVRNNMGYMKSGGRAGFKGGGADTGRIGQLRSDLAIAKNTADNKAALKKADQDRNKFDKVAKADLRDRNK